MCRSPELIAAYRGLHRLCVPRHPPHTFVRLTRSQPFKQSTRDYRTSDALRPDTTGRNRRNRYFYASLRFFVLAAEPPPDGDASTEVPTITTHIRCQTARAPPGTGGATIESRSRTCGTSDNSGTFEPTPKRAVLLVAPERR